MEVTGYVQQALFSPVLEDAVLRRTGHGGRPAARRVTAQIAADGAYDAELIEVDGVLVDHLNTGSERILVMASGTVSFKVHDLSRAMTGLDRGARLRVRGICRMEPENRISPRSPPNVHGAVELARRHRGTAPGALAHGQTRHHHSRVGIVGRVRGPGLDRSAPPPGPGQTAIIQRKLDTEASLKKAAESANRRRASSWRT